MYACRKPSVLCVRISSALILCLTAGHFASGAPPGPGRSTLDAVEQAHAALWSKFVDKNGIILDYVADLPTPEECARSYPNGLGWFTPIENGPMFTGPYLIAQCERARRTGKPIDKEQARTLANGLLKLASASEVKGMIVRGLGSDGHCHYPIGSDDQTQPWFTGLYAYWNSGIPTDDERKAIAVKVREVADALETNGWRCPNDGAFKGSNRNWFGSGGFRDAARLVTMLKVTYRMTGDSVWQERYLKKLKEIPTLPDGLTQTRLESIEEGYGPSVEKAYAGKRKSGPHWTWIYVGAVTGLKLLAEMEEDPAIKARYVKGLAACSREAFPDALTWARRFSNSDTNTFGYANWRAVFHEGVPQKTIEQAVKASESADKDKAGRRLAYENQCAKMPLACAVIAAQTGDPAYRADIEKALRHYDYDKLYTSVSLVYAECAYYLMCDGKTP